MLLAKIIIIIMLLLILYSLGSGLYYLAHDQSKSKRLIKSLTWRISLSLILFIFLIVSYYLGWIKPH